MGPHTINLTDNQGGRGTGFNGLSSVKRQDEDEQMKRTLAVQMMQIQELQTALDSKQSLIQDLNIRIQVLQTEISDLRLDQGRVQSERKQNEAQVQQKDEIILKIEQKLKETVAKLDNQQSIIKQYESTIQRLEQQSKLDRMAIIERSEIQNKAQIQASIVRLQSVEQDLIKKEEIINRLTTQLQQKQFKSETKTTQEIYKNIKVAPKVERIDKPMYEVKYKQDPFILEQNQKLDQELEQSLQNERLAYKQIEQSTKEISELRVDDFNNLESNS